jgi:hypothetical protein
MAYIVTPKAMALSRQMIVCVDELLGEKGS